jgi:hypothetical protein
MMTITIELTLDEERRLQERAAQSGQNLTAYLRGLIREDLEVPPSAGSRAFAEILAPIHAEFRESGVSQGDLETLLREEVNASRADRRQASHDPR